ncbi:Xenobiotic-transporting ATPase [Bertholletia excelsa]
MAFSLVIKPVLKDSNLLLVNMAFLFLFLTCVLIDIFKKRRDFCVQGLKHEERGRRRTRVSAKITLLFNVLISILYVGFCCYACVISIYSHKKTTGEYRRPPLVLIFFWVFSCIVDLLLISGSLMTHFTSREVPICLPEATIVEFTTFPLLIALCLNALPVKGSERSSLERPLLVEDEYNRCKHIGGFSSAGIWSQLTFSRLDPLFEEGRTHWTELYFFNFKNTVPSLPQFETSSFASSLLEESIKKQKSGTALLPTAIFQVIWRPLAINGVFAGVNTVASYLGPFLITNFVNFLSSKEDGSNYNQGLILAFILLFAKTVESLSQRQWYFGAQRIGRRVRSAIMDLIYKKSFLINCGGMSNGKVINLITVDVEKIGDFLWSIHGVWLLPVQVTLALIILYKNLGAAPSIAALLATIFVIASNTPMVFLQKKLHTKIMEAKDSRIKATSETLKGMRVIKLHSWEPTFLKNLLKLRETERNWLKRYLYTCSAVAFLYWTAPTLVSVVTFGVCIVLRTPLNSCTVLSALATFRILQEPIHNLPELVSIIAQTKVSVDRIQNFIKDDEKKGPYHPGEYAWETCNSSVPRKPTIGISEKMRITEGQKVAICGSVGSGKSSLLYGILGEIRSIQGPGFKVYGSKAFVPQRAWIQTGTVKENVLRMALKQDIEMWADGDFCVVGERGLNLSGGQKQRIQLARAIYHDSDIYFLDDPFSAVDARTGAHLFKNCLLHLLFHMTVIYVTLQLEFLQAADLVVVMKDGRIAQSGKYEDLIADPDGELSLTKVPHLKNSIEVSEEKSEISTNSGTLSERTQEEETETGRVKWHVYSTFITSAYKGALVPVVLLCQVFFQGLQISSNYWIAWATDEKSKVSKEKMIWVFVLMSGVSSIFILARAVLLSTIAIETAQRLSLGMINSVFQAPLSFFDSTPSSQILNTLLSIIILMSQIAWPVFFLFLAILAISFWYQSYYITTARELARMVGIRKAPILHHFSESLTGAATIRCFNQEDRFLKNNLDLVDDYSRVAFHNSATMEWLCVRINFLFNFVFFLVLIILVNLPRSAIEPSMAGLVATYGLNLNILQAWVVWNLCNVENKMISVERILQFTNVPSEAPLVIEDCRPESKWPIEGKFEMKNLHVQYNPSLPRVLKGITCTFPGSGKSTLIQALFRVVEPSEGQILIDGVDITKIGLMDLRSRLSIIPQDSILFQGTMRSNVDPLQQYSDQDIWEFLDKCHLADTVRQDQRNLDMPVAEDGENWSVGQRQLVCLARVLLQKRKILVLDEATASVDTATDNVIQRRIREETSRCTLITVAHRIPTIIDNDLVLVLDEGKVVEYDSPSELLKNKSSAFSKLVLEFVRRSSSNNHH